MFLLVLPAQAQNTSLDLPYKTEQEWIIMSVCRDIYELISFAADGKGEQVPFTAMELIPHSTDSYTVTLKGAHGTVTAHLKWDGSIWSSRAYLPFARAAAHVLNFTPPSPPLDSSRGHPLHTLLDFTDVTIKSEADRVSTWITAEPGNPQAYEQAALILGTFAMKENSGYFFNVEEQCNQASAHLTMARLLEPALHGEGQMGECEVGLVTDTSAACTLEMKAMAALPDAGELTPWLSAAQVRNTRNWTTISEPEAASPLEQVQYFRALAGSVGTDQALVWWSTNIIHQDMIDWGRIVTELPFSVEAGHKFAMEGVDSELTNMQSVFPGRYGFNTQISDLNEMPGDLISTTPSPHIQVISDGLWAQYFQRHLLLAFGKKHYFLEKLWGVPDQVVDLEQKFTSHFQSLLLFPLARIALGKDSDKARSLFLTHPELGYSWVMKSIPPMPPDLVENWYSPSIPTGTAYDFETRMHDLKRNPDVGPNIVDKLFEICPDHYSVARLKFVRDYSERPTYAQFQKVLGRFTAFDPNAVKEANRCRDITIDQRIALYTDAARMNPGWYYAMATTYQSVNLPDKAAEAYQLWYSNETDRVSVSNNMQWLVMYYYDHGQKDKALLIAAEGARVFSAKGLETLLLLEEKMGNLDGARELAAAIQQRYGDSRPLLALAERHPSAPTGSPTPAPAVAMTPPKVQTPTIPTPTPTPTAMTASTKPTPTPLPVATPTVPPAVAMTSPAVRTPTIAPIPTSMPTRVPVVMASPTPPVDLDSYHGAPSAGVQLESESSATKRIGLDMSMVIVAVDGAKVTSIDQYTSALHKSSVPEVKFVIWDGSKFREIKANQPGRIFGVTIRNYSPPVYNAGPD